MAHGITAELRIDRPPPYAAGCERASGCRGNQKGRNPAALSLRGVAWRRCRSSARGRAAEASRLCDHVGARLGRCESGVDLNIVGAVSVDDVHLPARFTKDAVTPLALAPLKGLEIAAHADEESVDSPEHV
jgi:hypothetical protein